MPFVLLLTQQAAQLHELSHWHAITRTSASGTQAQAVDVDEDFCLTCLAFAQVGGLAKLDIPVAPSVDGLSFHFASEPARHVAEATPPTARNRGPPAAL